MHDLGEVHIFETVIVPDLRGQNERDESQPLPVGRADQDACLLSEALEVDEAQDRDFLLHAPRNNHVLAEVVKLLNSGLRLVQRHFYIQLIAGEVVILVKNAHLELECFTHAFFRVDVELEGVFGLLFVELQPFVFSFFEDGCDRRLLV